MLVRHELASADWILYREQRKITDMYINLLYKIISDDIDAGTYLITGATGNIAKYIVLLLLKKPDVKVVAVCHSGEKGKYMFADFLDSPNLEVIEWDVSLEWKCKIKIDFIIHAAGICSNFICKNNPEKVLDTNIIGTANILKLAKQLNVKKFLYFSSAAVYGKQLDGNTEILTEDGIGILEFDNIANVYAVSKQAGEALCAVYSNQYNLPIIIVRPFHIIEPMMMMDDSSMLGGFYKSILQNREIIINTGGKQKRNFIWIMDLIEIIFLILKKGKIGEKYNLGNPYGTFSVLEMAYFVKEKIESTLGEKSVKIVVNTVNSAKTSNMVDLVPDLSKMMSVCENYSIRFMSPKQAIALCIS